MCISKDRFFHLVNTNSQSHCISKRLCFWAIWATQGNAVHEAIYQNIILVMGGFHKFLPSLEDCEGENDSSEGVLALQHTPSGFPEGL
jgi:hypothetical protein